MKNRNVVTALAAVAAVALVAGSVAIAAGHGPRGAAGVCATGAAGMRGHGMAGMQGPGMAGMQGRGMPGLGGGLGIPLHRLNVTDEQRDAIRAIVEADQPALHELREKIRESRQAFIEAHPATEFDEAAIRAHAAEQAPLLADLAVAEASLRVKALAVLTPEQLTQLKDMRSQRHERMVEQRGLRRGR